MQILESNLDSMDVAELLVATPDQGDPLIDPVVFEVLQLVRDKIGLEAVFVREVRAVDHNWEFADSPGGPAEAAETAWGRQLLTSRLELGDEEGCHLSVPVALHDGRHYGTLCGLSHGEWAATADLRTLTFSARLIAQKMLPPTPQQYEGLMAQPQRSASAPAGSQPQQQPQPQPQATGFSLFPQPWY